MLCIILSLVLGISIGAALMLLYILSKLGEIKWWK